ncbi:MAG: HEAT repeat domain-containing protein [Solirubrobacteraceae bacterium]
MSAVVLAALDFCFATVLALRRLQLTREERARGVLEERLRPDALALLDGEPSGAGQLGEREARALAGLVGRYVRWLSGEARGRAAAFFEARGDVDRQVGFLSDRRSWRRAVAAYTLGDMGSAAAVAPLLGALGDPARDVRSAAARSLGRLGAVEAVEPLVYALAQAAVPRAGAGAALLAIGAAALPSLRGLDRRAEPEVRAATVELLGLLGDAGDAPLLIERLGDSAAEVRAKAARALGRLGAEDAAAQLRVALRDRIPFVRASAAFALGAMRDRAALPGLLVQAREDRFEAAQAAARAAALIDPDAVRAAALSGGVHLQEAADLLVLSRA